MEASLAACCSRARVLGLAAGIVEADLIVEDGMEADGDWKSVACFTVRRSIAVALALRIAS